MRSRARQRIATLAVALILCVSAVGQSRWQAPAEEMARKIASVCGPGTATLDVQNASTLAAAEVPAIRHALDAQLRAGGIQVRAQNAANAIRLTLRENVRGWLWVAEIVQGTDTRVVMLEVPAERTPAASAQSSLVTLRSTLLVSAAEPLLDAQMLDANTLFALTTRSVTLYQRQADHWQAVGTQAIVTSVPMPRDQRGRVAFSNAGYDVFLPGVHCTAAAMSAAPECRESDDPWPLAATNAAATIQPQSGFYNSGRNFFTGVLSPGLGRQLPAFFSAAPIARAKDTQWIFTLLDGRAVAEDVAGEQRLGGATRNWGSDIVSVQSECGARQQILATAAASEGAEDSLQAFEITGRDATAVSAPLKFAGSITALWPAATNSAVAVIHNPQGGYDAYSITLACH